MRGHLDDWHQDAILVDVELDLRLRLRQYQLGCPWCAKRHLLIVDRRHEEVGGYMVCGNCGQFFRYALHPATDASTTRRVRIRPRVMSPLIRAKAHRHRTSVDAVLRRAGVLAA